MDDLERIRRKVEAGEALSDAEWTTLSGAGLPLVAAHALSNADGDAAAFAAFERLWRERPADVRVQMGRARALAGLERYAEAEAALNDVLARHPDDPEVLKALAN